MPVEINELVIRATISDNPADHPVKVPPEDDAKRLQKILDEVLKKCKTKNER